MTKNRNKRLAGYRLHLKRLSLSNSPSIRTVKFPLGVSEGEQIVLDSASKNLATRIKRDYERLYGPLNISTYDLNPNIYSLKDFWLDMLKAGAVMKHNEAKLINDLRFISGEAGEIDRKQQQLIKSKNSEFYSLIDFRAFKEEIILGKEIRTTKNRLHFFKEENEKTEKLEAEILMATKGKSREEQRIYWSTNYGINKNLYDSKTPKTTFYLLPEIKFNSQEELEPIVIVNRLNQYWDNKYGRDVKVEEYIGISDSQGGLSQAFGKVFDLLLADKISELKDMLLGLSNIWCGQEAELERRLQYLSTCAKKLGKPQLVNSWSDYRTDFGGKVQSWLSNGLRQDGIIKDHLFGKKPETAISDNKEDITTNHQRGETGHYGDIKRAIIKVDRDLDIEKSYPNLLSNLLAMKKSLEESIDPEKRSSS